MGWWLDSGFGGFRWWLDLLLNNFGKILGSCTKWAFFCTAIYDEMLIISIRVALFIVKWTIAKYTISIKSIPVFHADDLVSLLNMKLSYSFSLQGVVEHPELPPGYTLGVCI